MACCATPRLYCFVLGNRSLWRRSFSFTLSHPTNQNSGSADVVRLDSYQAKLTDEDVESIFKRNEVKLHLSDVQRKHTLVHTIHSNQVAVNRPVEDRWTARRCRTTGSILLGVFDGHSGAACAHSVQRRAPDYLALALLDDTMLETAVRQLCDQMTFQCDSDFHTGLTHSLMGETVEADIEEPLESRLQSDLQQLHLQQLTRYAEELLSSAFDLSGGNRGAAARNAFVRLDHDLCNDLLISGENLTCHSRRPQLRAALSGAVGVLTHVSRDRMLLCHTGDCGAVLATRDFEANSDAGSLNNSLLAVKLVEEHNANNPFEVQRIRSQHPPSEAPFILRYDRLLGELMPLRAFGDVRFKWSAEHLRSLASHLQLPANYNPVPAYYYTPPYLIATPEVVRRRLQAGRDIFLILASDGLWDFLSPEEAVSVVETAAAQGTNAATALVRRALGGCDAGPAASRRISRFLSLPRSVARYYRDDITIIVAFFESAEYS